MPPSPETSKSRIRLLLGLIALGYGLRLAIWLVTLGSNDIVVWYTFAVSIADSGLAQTYLETFVDQPGFNHPPLMAYLALAALWLSEVTGIAFQHVFKLPSLVAEVATGLLLYRVWRDRAGLETGLLALCAYALSLSSIMISGYHGNTDAVYFFLAFAAAYLMEAGRSSFWAGLALGAALNVKLIPAIVVLPLASRCRSWPDLRRYTLGVSLGLLPFLWALATFGGRARRAFLEGVFLYQSYREYWGVELFVRWTRALLDLVSEVPGYLVRIAGNLYGSYGGSLILAVSAALALWHVVRSRREGRSVLDAYELTALGFLVFLILGPGFGVQYVGCVVAPLMATSIRRGVIVATATGVFITALYAYFAVDWAPMYSVHTQMPAAFTLLSLPAWGVLVWAARGLSEPLRAGSAPAQS